MEFITDEELWYAELEIAVSRIVTDSGDLRVGILTAG